VGLKLPKISDRLLFAAALAVAVLMLIRFAVHKAPEKTTLVFAYAEMPSMNQKEEELLHSLAGEFEALNPEIRIRFEKKSYDELKNLVRETPGTETENTKNRKTVPDIAALDDWLLRDGIRKGSLVSPYADKGDEHGEIPPETSRTVPLVSLVDVLFYNIDILKAAGLDRPPGNYGEFLAAAEAVAKYAMTERAGADEIHAVALALSPDDPRSVFRDVFSWMWAAGSGPLSPETDGNFPGRRTAAALEFLGQLARDGRLAPGTFEKTGMERLEEFAEGKIGMMTGSVKDIAFLEKSMKGAFGITRVPGPAEYPGRPVFALYGLYAGILRQCAHIDEARAFLAFLAEKNPGETAWMETEDPLSVKARDMYEAAGIIQGYAGFIQGAELEDLVRKELVPLLEGNRSGADTAAAIANQWKIE
jgi:ABC-type glycerol-3-phosphate transport system substrate-binding protein